MAHLFQGPAAGHSYDTRPESAFETVIESHYPIHSYMCVDWSGNHNPGLLCMMPPSVKMVVAVM
jgi:hypothetical protein